MIFALSARKARPFPKELFALSATSRVVSLRNRVVGQVVEHGAVVDGHTASKENRTVASLKWMV
jgi:hypothetical protein